MARWDRESTRWVDAFACNSNAVRERIRAFYGRESDVIFPPVATDFYSPVQGSREDRALVVSRLVPYKRVDVAIEACAIAEMPLTVAGVGPDRDRLVECASRVGADVEFIGAPSDIELRELYRRARLLVFPAEEDFGIIPVEAQSAGMPVIALARGGARDMVVDGVTGALVASGTPAAFADAISQWRHRDVDNAACSANARRFDTSEFVEHVRAWVRREAGRV